MAERRMFTTKIIDSDAFLDMSLSAQCLYFHLNMRADDDGFVNNPKKIQRMIGASNDDLNLLIAKRFVLVFETGVMVIKHWRMHNLLRKDRYSPTQYQEEYQRLKIKANGSYTEDTGNQLATAWQPSDNQMAPQDSIGKDSIGKDSIDISEAKASASSQTDPKHIYGEYKHVRLKSSEISKLTEEYGEALTDSCITFLDEYIERKGYKAKSHYLCIRKWVVDAVREEQEKAKKRRLSDIDERQNDYKAIMDTIPDPLADIEEA